MKKATREAGDRNGPKGRMVWLCCQVHFHSNNTCYWPAYEKRQDVCRRCGSKAIAECSGPIKCWSRV